MARAGFSLTKPGPELARLERSCFLAMPFGLIALRAAIAQVRSVAESP